MKIIIIINKHIFVKCVNILDSRSLLKQGREKNKNLNLHHLVPKTTMPEEKRPIRDGKHD